MKTEDIKILKIELEAKEADDFKSALKKFHDENQRAGFKQVLTADEKEVIKNLNEKFK